MLLIKYYDFFHLVREKDISSDPKSVSIQNNECHEDGSGVGNSSTIDASEEHLQPPKIVIN